MAAIEAQWREHSFLGRLSGSECDALLRLGVAYAVRRGHILLAQGEQSRHVIILLDGYAKVTMTAPDFHDALLDVRGRGDIVGELAAMNGAARSATVTACGHVITRIISQGMFETFLADHPAAARQLTASVGDKLGWADRRRADFIGLPARARIACVLRDLAVVFGSPANLLARIDITQPELASIAGVREVTVQKALRELRDMGIVSTGYRRVTIVDPIGLNKLAEAVDIETDGWD